MRGTIGGWPVAMLLLAAACTRGDELDPQDLTARDLLGLDPRIAVEWSGDERDAAHETFEAAFRLVDPDGELAAELALDAALAAFPEVAIARGLDAADVELDAADLPPRLAVHVGGTSTPDTVTVTELALGGLPAATGTPTPIVPIGWEAGEEDGWDALPRRAPGFLVALAERAGRPPSSTPLEVVPAPRVGFAAAWLEDADRLLVNPVLLATLEVEADAAAHPFGAGGPLAWSSADVAAPRDVAEVAGGSPEDEALWFPGGGGIDAGPDATPPPPSGGGESCEGPTCDGPDCGGCDGSGCSDGGCGSDGGGCGGDGGSCGNSGGGGQCDAANRRGGSTVAWFLIPLLLLRRWRLREREQARRACDPG